MENIMENIYIYIIYFDVVNSDRGLYSSDPFIPLIEIKSMLIKYIKSWENTQISGENGSVFTLTDWGYVANQHC